MHIPARTSSCRALFGLRRAFAIASTIGLGIWELSKSVGKLYRVDQTVKD